MRVVKYFLPIKAAAPYGGFQSIKPYIFVNSSWNQCCIYYIYSILLAHVLTNEGFVPGVDIYLQDGRPSSCKLSRDLRNHFLLQHVKQGSSD